MRLLLPLAADAASCHDDRSTDLELAGQPGAPVDRPPERLDPLPLQVLHRPAVVEPVADGHVARAARAETVAQRRPQVTLPARRPEERLAVRDVDRDAGRIDDHRRQRDIHVSRVAWKWRMRLSW